MRRFSGEGRTGQHYYCSDFSDFGERGTMLEFSLGAQSCRHSMPEMPCAAHRSGPITAEEGPCLRGGSDIYDWSSKCW